MGRTLLERKLSIALEDVVEALAAATECSEPGGTDAVHISDCIHYHLDCLKRIINKMDKNNHQDDMLTMAGNLRAIAIAIDNSYLSPAN